MYCRHCGKKIEDDSRFCGFCGTAVLPIGQAAPAPSADPAPATVPASAEPVPSTEPESAEPLSEEGAAPAASATPAAPAEPAPAVPAQVAPTGAASATFLEREPARPVNSVPEGAHVSLSIQESGARRKRVVGIVKLSLTVLILCLIGFGLWSHFSHPDPSKMDEETYKKEALMISYEDFFDNTKEYRDVLVTFTGTVSEKGGSGTDSWILLDTYYDPATDLYYGGTVLVRGDEALIREWKSGQNVVVYGITDDERQTKNTATGTYDVPVIRAGYIDKK